MECAWIAVTERMPEFDVVVAATDGKHRWLDMRLEFFGQLPNYDTLCWGGYTATHWHPLASLETIKR